MSSLSDRISDWSDASKPKYLPPEPKPDIVWGAGEAAYKQPVPQPKIAESK